APCRMLGLSSTWLVNLSKYSVPACSAAQVNESVPDPLDPAPEPLVGIIILRSVYGPVDQHRLSSHRAAIHKSPVAAVLAVVPIISHYEIPVGRNHKFIVLNIVLDLIGPFRQEPNSRAIGIQRRERVRARIRIESLMYSIRLPQQFSIDEDAPQHDPQPISRHADYALHVVRMIFILVFENDKVATANFAIRQELLVPGAVAAKNKFIHQEMIPREKRGAH